MYMLYIIETGQVPLVEQELRALSELSSSPHVFLGLIALDI